jgi:hypothetical protein
MPALGGGRWHLPSRCARHAITSAPSHHPSKIPAHSRHVDSAALRYFREFFSRRITSAKLGAADKNFDLQFSQVFN